MYRLSGVLCLLVGLFALWYSYTLSLGSLTNPAPGLWPFVLSVVVVVCSVMVLLTERDAGEYESFTAGTLTILAGLASLSVFIVLFDLIGFILPGFLTFVFWLRFIGGESWRLSLTLAAAATGAFYVVFVVLLGVPFPGGPFGF